MKVVAQQPAIVVEVHNCDETCRLGRHLADLLVPGCVVGLIGPLGAGKTYLARAIAESLGVPPVNISSPTYVLINEYEGRIPVFHFDTYRLESKEAFDDLGSSEYFDRSGVCLVEWADRVMDRLPSNTWIIRLEPGSNEDRLITIEMPEPLASQLFRRLEQDGVAERRSDEHG